MNTYNITFKNINLKFSVHLIKKKTLIFDIIIR